MTALHKQSPLVGLPTDPLATGIWPRLCPGRRTWMYFEYTCHVVLSLRVRPLHRRGAEGEARTRLFGARDGGAWDCRKAGFK